MVKNTPKINNQQLVDLTAKNLELEEKYKRALADYQNQERRHKELESQIVKMSNAVLIEKLLFILDSLKLAETHLKDPGLIMILGQLIKVLESEGLKRVETTNQVFDPTVMDCAEIVPGEKDLCVETVLEGYYLNDKVLRPAKVKVGSGESTVEQNNNR